MAENQILDRVTVAIPSTQNVKNSADHFTVRTIIVMPKQTMNFGCAKPCILNFNFYPTLK